MNAARGKRSRRTRLEDVNLTDAHLPQTRIARRQTRNRFVDVKPTTELENEAIVERKRPVVNFGVNRVYHAHASLFEGIPIESVIVWLVGIR
jgi:hypothetical protein